MEFCSRLFHAVVFVGAVFSRKGFFRGKVYKNREVGQIVFDGVRVDVRDKIKTQSPRIGLIGEGRIDIPIANDDFSFLQRGLHPIVNVLHPRGCI